MSKVALSGNASGTGTFTIASPNSNTDRVLTLPDATGTILTTATPGVPVNGPAFSASIASGQAIANNTAVKINFTTENFDTNNNFASSRFTPTVAGYYQVNLAVALDGSVAGATNSVLIYKNGASLIRSWTAVASGNYSGSTISAIIYLNGSTDYIEAYCFQNTGLTLNTLTGDSSGFSAAMIRSA